MKGIINANSPKGVILKQKSKQITENNHREITKQFMKKT